MRALIILSAVLACLTGDSHGQAPGSDWKDTDSPPPFEVYGLASGMGRIDAVGLADGARAGFVWRQNHLGLVADIGLHKYSDHTGSTTMAPLMAGIRVYSDEHLRTTFFGDFLSGIYLWKMHAPSVNFTHVKPIISLGGGMDIRLTHRLVLRPFELQIMIAGAQNGPQPTSTLSSGIAYRFGKH